MDKLKGITEELDRLNLDRCKACNSTGTIFDDESPSGRMCVECMGGGAVPKPSPEQTLLSREYTTSRRIRVGFTSTQKDGWKYESTIEIDSDDPGLNLDDELTALDETARHTGVTGVVDRQVCDDLAMGKYRAEIESLDNASLARFGELA